MSDTPMVNAALEVSGISEEYLAPESRKFINFARDLERQLSAAKALRPEEECSDIPGLRLAMQHIIAQHAVWDKTEINARHLLSRLESGIQALIDNRSHTSSLPQSREDQ